MGKPCAGLSFDDVDRLFSRFSGDYRFGPLNIMILLAVCLGGMVGHFAVYPFRLGVVVDVVGTALVLGVLLRLTQVWRGLDVRWLQDRMFPDDIDIHLRYNQSPLAAPWGRPLSATASLIPSTWPRKSS